jgi:hypothetical protein
MFPIEDPRLRARIVDEILPTILADNVKARLQAPDGTYTRLQPVEGQPAVRSQVVLQDMARGSARESVEVEASRFMPGLSQLAPDGGGNGAGERAALGRGRKAKRRRPALRRGSPPGADPTPTKGS